MIFSALFHNNQDIFRSIHLDNRRRAMLIAFLLIGIMVFVFWTVYKYRVAKLTPKIVLDAIREAGVEVTGLQDITTYPGPLLPAQEGLRFSTHAQGKYFDVLIVLYSSRSEAKRSAQEVNALNRRMSGHFGSAYTQGRILLLVGTTEPQIARQFRWILRSTTVYELLPFRKSP